MESAGNGGFNYYRRPAQTSSGMQLPAEMVMMRLPAIDNSGINNSNRHHYHVINSEVDNECTVREQDRFMPIANVIRIMRRILPPHAKISDDAKETIQECVSEFIGFITGEANERCQEEQRKTITAEDVLWAMSKLGFDDYMEPLTFYLNRYREFEGDTRGSIRGEPLVMRRPVDVTAMGVPVPATFGPPPPPFHHMGHHHNLVHHQQHGFVGVPAVGGFMRDGSSPGSSQGGLGAIEPYEQGKQLNNSRSI